MRWLRDFVVKTLVAGLIVVVPIYLAALLLLEAMHSVTLVVRPLAGLLPKWLPAEQVLSLLLVLAVCFLVGLAVRTRPGRAARERIEKLLARIPGYSLLRTLSRRLAGDNREAWQPALADIEDALVPAFIVEELADGRRTVFVPSSPTPLMGAVYVLAPERVHPLDVPLTQAIKVVTQWGSGAKDLVVALGREPRAP